MYQNNTLHLSLDSMTIHLASRLFFRSQKSPSHENWWIVGKMTESSSRLRDKHECCFERGFYSSLPADRFVSTQKVDPLLSMKWIPEPPAPPAKDKMSVNEP